MKLSFKQARECVFRVYEKRGQIGGHELIVMMYNLNLIDLNDRSKLQDIIITFDSIDSVSRNKK